MNVTQNEQGDHVCEHGTAVDVHCCNCHSGFLFDVETCVCEGGTGLRAVQFPDSVSVKMLETTLAVLQPKLDSCAPYLKDGETPAECLKRNRADIESLLGQLATAKLRAEAAEARLQVLQDFVRRVSNVYTVDTDQAALIRLVLEAKQWN